MNISQMLLATAASPKPKCRRKPGPPPAEILDFKMCNKCGEKKSINCFRKSKIRDRITYRGDCKICERKTERERHHRRKVK